MCVCVCVSLEVWAGISPKLKWHFKRKRWCLLLFFSLIGRIPLDHRFHNCTDYPLPLHLPDPHHINSICLSLPAFSLSCVALLLWLMLILLFNLVYFLFFICCACSTYCCWTHPCQINQPFYKNCDTFVENTHKWNYVTREGCLSPGMKMPVRMLIEYQKLML